MIDGDGTEPLYSSDRRVQVGKGRSVGAGPGVVLPLVQVSTGHVEEATPRAPCRALCVPRVLSDTDSENFKLRHIGRPCFYDWGVRALHCASGCFAPPS